MYFESALEPVPIRWNRFGALDLCLVAISVDQPASTWSEIAWAKTEGHDPAFEKAVGQKVMAQIKDGLERVTRALGIER